MFLEIVNFFLFWGAQRSCDGQGAHSALFGVLMASGQCPLVYYMVIQGYFVVFVSFTNCRRTLSYALCFNNQTAKKTRREGLEREGLEMEGLEIKRLEGE